MPTDALAKQPAMVAHRIEVGRRGTEPRVGFPLGADKAGLRRSKPLGYLPARPNRQVRSRWAMVRRGVAQPGSAPALGAGGPGFESRRPDFPAEAPRRTAAGLRVIEIRQALDVVATANDVSDNRIENGDLVMATAEGVDEIRAALGTFLILEHRDGEFSTMAYLAAGSIPLKLGDRVRRGDSVGRNGFSGDTGLHVTSIAC